MTQKLSEFIKSMWLYQFETKALYILVPRRRLSIVKGASMIKWEIEYAGGQQRQSITMKRKGSALHNGTEAGSETLTRVSVALLIYNRLNKPLETYRRWSFRPPINDLILKVDSSSDIYAFRAYESYMSKAGQRRNSSLLCRHFSLQQSHFAYMPEVYFQFMCEKKNASAFDGINVQVANNPNFAKTFKCRQVKIEFQCRDEGKQLATSQELILSLSDMLRSPKKLLPSGVSGILNFYRKRKEMGGSRRNNQQAPIGCIPSTMLNSVLTKGIKITASSTSKLNKMEH
uniref:Uncharacterized protein n=1 Tax=Romanomermis culicivorax TaxID=13658 RepID=A0A915HVK3_ROMCU